MLAFEDDSHFEREAEIAILKRTCTPVSSFMPSASNVNRQGQEGLDLSIFSNYVFRYFSKMLI